MKVLSLLALIVATMAFVHGYGLLVTSNEWIQLIGFLLAAVGAPSILTSLLILLLSYVAIQPERHPNPSI